MRPFKDRVVFEAWSVADERTGELWRPGPRQVAITGQTEARANARWRSTKKRRWKAVRVKVSVEEIPE